MRLRGLVAAGGILAALGACSAFVSLDGLGDGVAMGDAGGDAGGDTQDTGTVDVDTRRDAEGDATSDASETGSCPPKPGPPMVYVTAGSGFCIDSTEVTVRQYADFVAAVAGGAPIRTPPEGTCAWNLNVTPSPGPGYGCTAAVSDPAMRPDFPISCVNWCDAYAYCAWAGKRLCGKTGGGSLDYSAPPQAGEWAIACSANNTRVYPYGNTLGDAGTCNTADITDGGLPVARVATFPGCVGGYAGLYDMAGNVEEWVDSCTGDAGAVDQCHERGDTVSSTTAGPGRCDNADFDNRDLTHSLIGIRCCSL